MKCGPGGGSRCRDVQGDWPGSESQALGHQVDVKGSGQSEDTPKKLYIGPQDITKMCSSQSALTNMGLVGPHFGSER